MFEDHLKSKRNIKNWYKNHTEGKRVLDVLYMWDKLDPVKENHYKNANKYRSLRATVRPTKTTDSEKQNELANELPISEMIWENINNINVTPGIWQRLCNQHLKKTQEISKIQENELKGSDLSIAALKRERMRYYSQPITRQSSPAKTTRSLSRISNRVPTNKSHIQTSRKINKANFLSAKPQKKKKIMR